MYIVYIVLQSTVQIIVFLFANCYSCKIVNNYSVINPITKIKNGVYKKKKLIDNPTTWKGRVDINRPWDYN